jgi:hypothetical protein
MIISYEHQCEPIVFFFFLHLYFFVKVFFFFFLSQLMLLSAISSFNLCVVKFSLDFILKFIKLLITLL